MLRRRYQASLIVLVLLALYPMSPTSPSCYAQAKTDRTLWVTNCETDKMDGRRRCVILRRNLLIGLDEKGSLFITVASDRERYPGKEYLLRVDKNEPFRTNTSGWLEHEAKAIIAQLLAGERILTRYTTWPRNMTEDEEFALDGFLNAWRHIQVEVKKR
jgi:hypothetical protein